MRVGCCCGNFERVAETKKEKQWKSRFLSSVVALFLNNKQHCAFFFRLLTASQWTLYLLFSTSPFSLARSLALSLAGSLHPVIPKAPSALLHV